MKCPSCKRGRLKVTNVITTGSGKTSAAECPTCRKRFTFVLVLFREITQRGDGPHAVAKRINAGEDPLEILSET
jgi:hypothetical protein